MSVDSVPEVPRVAVVTPHYGNVSAGLIDTLAMAVKDPAVVQCNLSVKSSSSVLPHCFNGCLAYALNARDEGRITHMAMCHSDILVTRQGWLDTLWSEMWTHNLKVISAVVPIKHPTARTSTAIGDEKDRWRIHRSLFVKDRANLPQTFTARHVCQPGEVLLINTGLMLVDLRLPFWDDFAFQFHTRVVKNPDGWGAECRSEDWEMSHDLHAAGIPYGATWAVKLRHEGSCKYANYPED